MSWFSNLFTSGISEVIDTTGQAIDRLVTSDAERDQLKIDLESELNRFKKEQLRAMASYDQEITQRHAVDMVSDSWLSKNIRPLTLAFLTVSTMVLAYLTIFILPESKAVLLEPWLHLLQIILVTIYSFYFGSRGFEKIQSIRNNNR